MGYFVKITNIIKDHRDMYGGTNLDILQKSFNEMGANKQPFQIEPNSRDKFEELKRKVQAVIDELEAKLESATKKEGKDLIARITDLKAAQTELTEIENSEHMYRFDVGDQPYFKMELDDTGTIIYDGTLGSLLNELKHAFQYETGKIDFLRIQNGSTTSVYPGLLYDMTDELATYKRQYALDGILTLKIALSDEQILAQALQNAPEDVGKVVITKMKKVKLNLIAKISDSIIDKGLYSNISKKELSSNSSLQDIVKNNKNRPVRKNHFDFSEYDKEQPYFEYIKVFVNERVIIDVQN